MYSWAYVEMRFVSRPFHYPETYVYPPPPTPHLAGEPFRYITRRDSLRSTNHVKGRVSVKMLNAEPWEPLTMVDYLMLGIVGTFQALALGVCVHLFVWRNWPPYVTKNVDIVIIMVSGYMQRHLFCCVVVGVSPSAAARPRSGSVLRMPLGSARSKSLLLVQRQAVRRCRTQRCRRRRHPRVVLVVGLSPLLCVSRQHFSLSPSTLLHKDRSQHAKYASPCIICHLPRLSTSFCIPSGYFDLPTPDSGYPHAHYTTFVSPTPLQVQTFAGFAWTFANALDVGFVQRSGGDPLAVCSLEVRTRLPRGSQSIVFGGRGSTGLSVVLTLWGEAGCVVRREAVLSHEEYSRLDHCCGVIPLAGVLDSQRIYTAVPLGIWHRRDRSRCLPHRRPLGSGVCGSACLVSVIHTT